MSWLQRLATAWSFEKKKKKVWHEYMYCIVCHIVFAASS